MIIPGTRGGKRARIRQLVAQGLVDRQIAERVGCRVSYVSEVRHGGRRGRRAKRDEEGGAR